MSSRRILQMTRLQIDDVDEGDYEYSGSLQARNFVDFE